MKKTIAILVLVILVGVGFLYFGGWVGEVPILEYKYKKGETLYYTEEGKQQAWGMGPKSWIKGPTVKSKSITGIKIKDITEKSEYEINEFGLVDTEGTGRFIGGEGTYYQKMSMKGDIEIRKEENTFFSSQPRFGEGRKRSWKKVISVSIDSVNIPARYKIIRKIWGEKDTYRIKTSWERVKVDNKGNKYSMRLKGYSDFDASEGRIIRMKTCFEGRVNGKLILKTDASWRLMSEEEIFKLSGLEKDWELVVPDGEEFDLSKDGKKLVWEIDRTPKQLGDTEIWVAETDGTGARRLPVMGFYPGWSPDSSMIVYTTIPDMNTPPPLRSYELHVFDLLNNDKKVGERVDDEDFYWLPDGRLLFYQEPPLQWKLVNPETHEIKEIDEATAATLYKDRWGTTDKFLDGRRYANAIVLKDGRFMFYEKHGTIQWKIVNPKTDEVIEIDKTEAKSLYQEELYRDGKGGIGRWSPDRRLLVIGGQMDPLKVKLLDGKEEILIPADETVDLTPIAWSPDGRFFIYIFDDRKTDMYSLKLYSLEKRETISQLTKWKSRPYITVVVWSPDGRYIYFGATHQVSSMFGIYRLRLPDEVVTVKKEGITQR